MKWYQVVVGIPILFLMAYAAMIGFLFQTIYYGFQAGRGIFDDFFETEAMKKNKAVTS